jgi:hypothetical protein
MHREFHIFASDEEGTYTLKRTGELAREVFSSLTAATRRLRDLTQVDNSSVVIFDTELKRVNRIPLVIGPTA